MALRMVLVALVACMGLNHPLTRGLEVTLQQGTLSVDIPVDAVSEPAALTASEPELLPQIERVLLDLGISEDQVDALLSTERFSQTQPPAVSSPSPHTPTEPVHVEQVIAIEPSCVDDANRLASETLISVVEVEPGLVTQPQEPDFEAVVDALVAEFALDLSRSTVSQSLVAPDVEAAPAPEASEVLAGTPQDNGPVSMPSTAPEDWEPYPGLAYQLNRESDGIDESGESMAGEPIAQREPETRVETAPSRIDRVAAAVRLTGQAIQAWVRIFVYTFELTGVDAG